MNIHEFEAYARATIPVPTGYLIATQSLQRASATDEATIRWDISHFPPENVSTCTIGQGRTPEAALAHLIPQLTPCTPSASATTPPLPASGASSKPEQPADGSGTTPPAAG